MGADVATRMKRLAARVRWADRFRRPLSVLLALVIAPLSLYQLRTLLEADWPLIPTVVPCLLWAGVIWWFIEAAFAFLVALWETEHDRLARATGGRTIGLPSARLVSGTRNGARRRRPRRAKEQGED